MLGTKWFLHILLTTFVLLAVCEARGGRRGGSMGGIFGSWRKYKKPSMSGGSSRRIVSSSPVHTPITKALNEKKTAGSDKFLKTGKTYGKYNTPPLPAGGTYYTNTAAMPGNAIYVAQAPPRGAEFGDFLTGYLTGRIMTMGLSPYPYHHQVTHVYHDNPNQPGQQSDSSDSGKVIVINNTPITSTSPATSTSASATTPSTTTTYSVDSTTERESSSPYALAFTSSVPTTTETTPPPYGIICMPLMVNETNASGVAVQVERIVCYPAPAPTAPIPNEMKSKPVEIAGDIIEH